MPHMPPRQRTTAPADPELDEDDYDDEPEAEQAPRPKARNLRAVEQVMDFSTDEEDERLDIADELQGQASIRFRLDGESFELRRPKTSLALAALHLGNAEDARTQSQVSEEMIRYSGQIINYVARENPSADEPDRLRGRARIMERLADPEDKLDIYHLFRPFQQLLEQLFNRPTQSRPASGAKPRSTKSASAGRSRGARAGTSTRSRRT